MSSYPELRRGRSVPLRVAASVAAVGTFTGALFFAAERKPEPSDDNIIAMEVGADAALLADWHARQVGRGAVMVSGKAPTAFDSLAPHIEVTLPRRKPKTAPLLRASRFTNQQLLAMFALTGESPPAVYPPPAPASVTMPLIYTVEPGDSIFGIADRLGVNPGNLAVDNHLNFSSTITPGEELRLPAPGEAPVSLPSPPNEQQPPSSPASPPSVGESQSNLAPVSSTDGTYGVTPEEYAEWSRVNMCEESGNWHVVGSEFSGGLGISNYNWTHYAAGLGFPASAADATPYQQIVVAMKIQPNPPDQNGSCSGW